MRKSQKRPNQISTSAIEAFSTLVSPGEYIYMPSSDVPEEIPQAGSDCQAVFIACAEMHSSDVPRLPHSLTPSGAVYWWRGFRTYPNDSPPRKVDDCLYYESSDGVAFSLHSKDSPDHYNHILTSMDMGGLISDWHLPSEAHGTLEMYIQEGHRLGFTIRFGEDEDSSS